MKNKKAIIFVNMLTGTRVIGTFLLPLLYFHLTSGFLVIYIMALLFTDALDGLFARRLQACTIFGSLLDQAADKLLGIATLIVLALSYPIMLLPILTEVIITIINIRAGFKGSMGESSILGKIKTGVMSLTIVAGYCTVYAADIINLLDNSTKIGAYLINQFTYVLNNADNIMNSLAMVAVGAGIMVACDYWLSAKNEIKKVLETGLKPEELKLKKGRLLREALFSVDYFQETKGQPIAQRLGSPTKKIK